MPLRPLYRSSKPESPDVRKSILHPDRKAVITGTEDAIAEHATTPAWSGINHLALITNDTDATVCFYQGVLGARIASTVGTPEFRHYFFEFGPQCTVAYFEYGDLPIEPFAKPVGVPDLRATQFDHLALNLPDDNALHGLRRRLAEADCETSDIVEHNSVHSIYLNDNNGIALEASCLVRDVTGRTNVRLRRRPDLQRPQSRPCTARTADHRRAHYRS